MRARVASVRCWCKKGEIFLNIFKLSFGSSSFVSFLFQVLLCSQRPPSPCPLVSSFDQGGNWRHRLCSACHSSSHLSSFHGTQTFCSFRQSDLNFGKIVGGVVTIATLWRWHHDRRGGEIDMNWKELSFLPYLMLNVASSGVIWNEIFTPEAILPKKPFPPKPKLPRKPCWNPAIIKPNPNPTLPYPNAIKY